MKFDNDYLVKLRIKKQMKRDAEKLKALENERKMKSEFDPRNVSKPKNWKGLKYNETEQARARAERKRKIMEKKRAAAKKDLTKYGPRDIEKPKNWKGMKYSEAEA